MIVKHCDIAIVGSGAGGGTIAAELIELAKAGKKIMIFEQGAKFADHEFTGRELEMSQALYEDGGGFLNREGTITLAFGRAYGGSTVVYTGTSLTAPKRVIDRWNVPGMTYDDIEHRTKKHAKDNNVHLLEENLLNDNNKFFAQGGRKAGFHVEQFPLNIKGCKGSSLCNLGCPNTAKQGTHRVQLPRAEAAGIETVTRAEVVRISMDKTLHVHVSEKKPHEKGEVSHWAAGHYRIKPKMVILAGGSIGTTALLLRSHLASHLPRLGHGFTCHPAHIVVAEHEKALTNDVGHPKSFFIDRAVEERFVLETCMYFPFTTAKNLTGFGPLHSQFMQSFSKLQMILILACDRAHPENRITVDRHGKAVVHYQFTPQVIEALVAGTRASAKVFFAAGALRMSAPSADPPVLERNDDLTNRIDARFFLPGRASVSAAHLMGGCGMGNSAADSVTDAWGRVHGIAWLRIADSSLFPDALEINPYLTIMALADRTAQMVREEIGGFVL